MERGEPAGRDEQSLPAAPPPPAEPPAPAAPAPPPERPLPGSRRFPRSAVLGTHLRRTDAALERQRSHVDAARQAIAVLRDLRDDLLRQAADTAAAPTAGTAADPAVDTVAAPAADPADPAEPSRADGLRMQAAGLTSRLADLERQLDTLEEADATARTRAVGLRQVEEKAGDAVPFRAGPMPGAAGPLAGFGGPGSPGSSAE